MKFVCYPDRDWCYTHRSRWVKWKAQTSSIKKFNHAVASMNRDLVNNRCLRISYVTDTFDRAGAVYIAINMDRVRNYTPHPKTTPIKSNIFIISGLLKKPRKPRKKKEAIPVDRLAQALRLDYHEEKAEKEQGTTYIW